MRFSGKVLRQIAAICFFLLYMTLVAVRAETGAFQRPKGDGNTDISVDFTGDNEGYSAVLYNNVNGLPTSEANAIAQTSEGFIWIGSYSGLIRYDGNQFERIDSSGGIASVVSLYVDSTDRLWVGTNDSGIGLIDRGEIKMFRKEDGMPSSSVRAVLEDNNGLIYAATSKGIAMIDRNMQLRRLDDERLNDRYIRRMESGLSGVIYGLTQDGAVFTIQNGKVESFYDTETLGVSNVVSIMPDFSRPGYVYLGTEDSLIIRGKLEEGFPYREEIDTGELRYINSMTRVQKQIWITADNGIGFLENGVLQILSGIPLDNSIEHLLMDYAGNLWFTSSRQGVMKIVPNQFYDIYDHYDLEPMVVNSTCLSDEKLFIATDRGLTVLSPEETVSELPLENCVTASGEPMEYNDLLDLIGDMRIRSIQRDSKERLWFACYGSSPLICYDGSSAVVFGINDGMPSDRARTTFELRDGTILVPCSGGDTAVIRNDEIVDYYSDEDGIGNADVLTIAQESDGSVVFGTDGDGMYIMRPEGVEHISLEQGLSSEVVMRVKKDNVRDLLWIVTSNSLAALTADGKVTTFNHFPYSNNFDLYENSAGDMWILSSNGIYVITAEDLLKNESLAPVFYGRDNGLPCIATANSYSDVTEDGDLYISGTTGVARVNIEVPFEDINDVKMAVPYVEADGKFIFAEKDGSFVIPPDVRKLTVYGYVYTYSLMNPQITYYLDGFDKSETTVRRSELGPVDYTNLPGGSYRYVMILRDAMGNGNKQLSISITKQKAIHEEGWFRILCGALFLGLIALAVIVYVRRKTAAYEKKEQEDQLFISEMTKAFAKTIDLKDSYTNGHSTRVAEYTKLLTKELGYDDETVNRYYNIALLHDIGKIGIASEVLNKPGKLTDEEFRIIKSHPYKGYEVLKDVSIMPELAIGAYAHHERPDGKGYPRGLKGSDIPRVAQIIAVADTFDAMYSDRPYRKRMNFDKAVSIIRDAAGTQLTQDVVDAFLRLADRGLFKAEDDNGGGTTEDIDNIHKSYEKQKTLKSEALKQAEKEA